MLESIPISMRLLIEVIDAIATQCRDMPGADIAKRQYREYRVA